MTRAKMNLMIADSQDSRRSSKSAEVRCQKYPTPHRWFRNKVVLMTIVLFVEST